MPDEDRLFQLPLAEFTSARTALAKAVGGARGREIRALARPTIPAWAVNQLYWSERNTWNALIDAAARMRQAHLAVLGGRAADLRAADEAHARAVSAALKTTTALLERGGQPATAATRDAISRTLQALPGDATPGRLTKALNPSALSFLGDAARVVQFRPREESRTEKEKGTKENSTKEKGKRERGKTETETETEKGQTQKETARQQKDESKHAQTLETAARRALAAAVSVERAASAQAVRAGLVLRRKALEVRVSRYAEARARRTWEAAQQRLARNEEGEDAARRANERAAENRRAAAAAVLAARTRTRARR